MVCTRSDLEMFEAIGVSLIIRLTTTFIIWCISYGMSGQIPRKPLNSCQCTAHLTTGMIL